MKGSFKMEKFMKRLANRHITIFYLFDRMKEYSRQDEVQGIRPGITYYFIMGFIPFLIFTVNVILFCTASDIDSVIKMLHEYFPVRMADALEADVIRIVSQRSDLWLWVSLIFSAISFEQGIAILVRSSDIEGYRNSGEKKVVDIFLTSCTKIDILVHEKSILYAIGLVISIMFSLGLTAFGNIIIHVLKDNFILPNVFLGVWNILAYAIPFMVLSVYLTIFYLSAPHTYAPYATHAVVTAFIVTILWLLATVVYRWFLMLIPSIGEAYGPLFGLFMMFTWFYIIVLIILLGVFLVKAMGDLQHKLDMVRHQ